MECHGCLTGAAAQEEHMDHPTGCLHDSSSCDTCLLSNKLLTLITMNRNIFGYSF